MRSRLLALGAMTALAPGVLVRGQEGPTPVAPQAVGVRLRSRFAEASLQAGAICTLVIVPPVVRDFYRYGRDKLFTHIFGSVKEINHAPPDGMHAPFPAGWNATIPDADDAFAAFPFSVYPGIDPPSRSLPACGSDPTRCALVAWAPILSSEMKTVSVVDDNGEKDCLSMLFSGYPTLEPETCAMPVCMMSPQSCPVVVSEDCPS
ncbi:unnamed protein product, partial [Scytosiphon promiscuus]